MHKVASYNFFKSKEAVPVYHALAIKLAPPETMFVTWLVLWGYQGYLTVEKVTSRVAPI